MSSLREELEQIVWDTFSPYLDYDNYVVDAALARKATDSIMLAIDSHIPEKQVGSWADERKDGFNEAVDLMREELK